MIGDRTALVIAVLSLAVFMGTVMLGRAGML